MRRAACSIFAAVAFALCTWAAAGAQQVELNPDQLLTMPSDPVAAMQSARGRVASGDLEGAIIGLQAYVAHHPGEIGPERLLGDLFYRKTELDRAEATYRHILSYAPGDKETHNRLGSVLATENRINDAIQEFNRSLPGADSIPDLVRLHQRKGDIEAYTRELVSRAERTPSDGEAQFEAGDLFEVTGNSDLAERYFKRALDDQPEMLSAINGLGLVYQDERRYSNALQEFKICLMHDPESYACTENTGATYLYMSNLPAAESSLNLAHSLEPESPEAIIDLGYLADERGNWKQAVELYVSAMTVYPYAPEAYIDLGDTYAAHGLYQLAASALVKGLAVAPYDGKLHFLLGDVYARQGNMALAAEQYRAAAVAQNIDVGLRRAAADRIASLRTPKPTASPIH